MDPLVSAARQLAIALLDPARAIIDSLLQRLAQSEQRIAELSVKNQNLEDAFKACESSYTTVQKSEQLHFKKSLDSERLLAQRDAAIKRLTDEVQQLRTSVPAAVAPGTTQLEECKKIAVKLSEENAAVLKLAETVSATKNMWVDKHAEISKKLQQAESDRKVAIAADRTCRTDLLRIQSVAAACEQKLSQLANIESQLQRQVKANSEMNSDLAEQQRLRSNAENVAARVQDEASKLQQQLVTLRVQYSEVEQKLIAAEGARKQAEDAISALQKQETACRQQLRGLENEIDKVRAEATKSRAELKKQDQQAQSSQSAATSCQSLLKSCNAINLDMQARIQKQTDASQATRKGFDESYNNLEKQLEAKTKEFQELQKTLRDEKRRNLIKDDELKKCADDKAVCRAKSAALTETRNQLQTAFDDCEKSKKLGEQNLTETRNQLKTAFDECEKSKKLGEQKIPNTLYDETFALSMLDAQALIGLGLLRLAIYAKSLQLEQKEILPDDVSTLILGFNNAVHKEHLNQSDYNLTYFDNNESIRKQFFSKLSSTDSEQLIRKKMMDLIFWLLHLSLGVTAAVDVRTSQTYTALDPSDAQQHLSRWRASFTELMNARVFYHALPMLILGADRYKAYKKMYNVWDDNSSVASFLVSHSFVSSKLQPAFLPSVNVPIPTAKSPESAPQKTPTTGGLRSLDPHESSAILREAYQRVSSDPKQRKKLVRTAAAYIRGGNRFLWPPKAQRTIYDKHFRIELIHWLDNHS